MAETAKQEKKEVTNEPRKYSVFVVADSGDLTFLHATDAKTSKEARRTVAQKKLTQEQLAAGIPLVAITSNSLKSGSGVARVKVEQRWDD